MEKVKIVLILILICMIAGISLFTYFKSITTKPEGQIIVKQSGGSSMLIAECADRSYINNTADYIVEGTVEKVESRWNDERTSIFTSTDILIKKYIKGNPFPENKIQIITSGGTVGEITQAVEDQSIFHEGRKVTIYLQETNGEFSIVCGQMGVEGEFNIIDKSSGTTEQIDSRLKEWTKESGVRIGGVSSCTIIKNNEYWMYYTGRDIELAKSSDGLNFVYLGTIIDVKDINGVDMVTNPSVFKTKDGKYRMIFEGSRMFHDKNDRKLYSAISSDGLIWAIEEGVRFQDVGDGKPDEIFTSVPDIIRLQDGGLRMYYTRGATSATALSNDEGLTWTKETNLKLRKVAIDLDIVLLNDSTYKLFFTTFEDEFGVGDQWVMSASSTDGINFVVDEGKLIEPNTSGGLVTDPDVIKIDNGYRMYYGEFKKGENEPNIMSAFSSG